MRLLEVNHGGGEVHRYFLLPDQTYTIGRKECRLPLPNGDPSISRHHATMIMHAFSPLVVQDPKAEADTSVQDFSKHGTFVNKELVGRESSRFVYPEDVIKFGKRVTARVLSVKFVLAQSATLDETRRRLLIDAASRLGALIVQDPVPSPETFYDLGYDCLAFLYVTQGGFELTQSVLLAMAQRYTVTTVEYVVSLLDALRTDAARVPEDFPPPIIPRSKSQDFPLDDYSAPPIIFYGVGNFLRTKPEPNKLLHTYTFVMPDVQIKNRYESVLHLCGAVVVFVSPENTAMRQTQMDEYTTVAVVSNELYETMAQLTATNGSNALDKYDNPLIATYARLYQNGVCLIPEVNVSRAIFTNDAAEINQKTGVLYLLLAHNTNSHGNNTGSFCSSRYRASPSREASPPAKSQPRREASAANPKSASPPLPRFSPCAPHKREDVTTREWKSPAHVPISPTETWDEDEDEEEDEDEDGVEREDTRGVVKSSSPPETTAHAAPTPPDSACRTRKTSPSPIQTAPRGLMNHEKVNVVKEAKENEVKEFLKVARGIAPSARRLGDALVREFTAPVVASQSDWHTDPAMRSGSTGRRNPTRSPSAEPPILTSAPLLERRPVVIHAASQWSARGVSPVRHRVAAHKLSLQPPFATHRRGSAVSSNDGERQWTAASSPPPQLSGRRHSTAGHAYTNALSQKRALGGKSGSRSANSSRRPSTTQEAETDTLAAQKTRREEREAFEADGQSPQGQPHAMTQPAPRRNSAVHLRKTELSVSSIRSATATPNRTPLQHSSSVQRQRAAAPTASTAGGTVGATGLSSAHRRRGTSPGENASPLLHSARRGAGEAPTLTDALIERQCVEFLQSFLDGFVVDVEKASRLVLKRSYLDAMSRKFLEDGTKRAQEFLSYLRRAEREGRPTANAESARRCCAEVRRKGAEVTRRVRETYEAVKVQPPAILQSAREEIANSSRSSSPRFASAQRRYSVADTAKSSVYIK